MTARLQPGQIAPGIKRVRDQKLATAHALRTAVTNAMSDPKNAPFDLLDACRSQQGLVDWCKKHQAGANGEAQSARMSLNTLKTHLDKLMRDEIDPGQSGFKVFWTQCQMLVSKADKEPTERGTKDVLSQQLVQVEATNQQLINDIIACSHQYLHLLKTCAAMAAKHPELQRMIQEHYARYPDAHHGLRIIRGGKDDGE